MKNECNNISYNQLLERVKELEQENERIAERAEEVLLLNALAENILALDNDDDLIDELLEKISILKLIPLCCCYQLIANEYVLLSHYVSVPFYGNPSNKIEFNDSVLNDINKTGKFCCCPKGVINGEFPIPITKNTESIVIAFDNKSLGKGVFLFMDEIKEYPISTKMMVIEQAIRMVLGRIEKLDYIKQIEQLNVGLEQRVVKRTKELLQINNWLRDEIEERKLMEEKLRLAKNKAQESDKLKSIFLANMSHEIRTPMNAIVGFSELMESGECKTDELREYSRLIYSNSLSLLNLINDLLDFSKIEANQLTLHCSTCNVNEIVEEVQLLGNSMLRQYKKEALKIEMGRLLPKNDALIISDKYRLKQILINLISNAIKFSFKGIVKISFEPINDKIFFTISDEGIGIDENMHKLIFNRFSRVSDDINKPIAGNGLGLTITKTLVTMLGGEISVDSILGEGSSFKFSILKKAPCSVEGSNCIE